MFDHQVVIKFLDGTLLKGFGSFITPGEMVVEVQDLQNEIHFIDMHKVKAVFYVRTLDGLNIRHSGPKRITRTLASGTSVRLVFSDGEEIIGLMTNPDAARTSGGFYITPTEEGNNYRIYVNRDAVEALYVERHGGEINLLL